MAIEPSRKPVAHRLGWRVSDTTLPFESDYLTVRQELVGLPGRDQPLAYSYVERAPGVIIVPVTGAGEIILIRQYRFPVDEWCLETPAGSTGDTGELPLEKIVRKELEEEVGATAGRIEKVSQFLPAPAYSTELCYVFIAWNAQLAEPPEPEPAEKIELEIVPAKEALRRAESGEIQNGACALALCHARRALDAAGFL